MLGSSLKQILKGSFWILIANLTTRAASFILLPILARKLGPASLGIYGIVQQTIQTADNLGRVGLDLAIHRNGAQHETIGKAETGRLFGVGGLLIALVGVLLAGSLWLFPDYIAANLLGEAKIAPWLAVAGWGVLFLAIAAPAWMYLVALQAFQAYSLNTALSSLLGNGITVLVAFNFGLGGALWSQSLTNLIQVAVGWWLGLTTLAEKGIKLRLDRFAPTAIAMLKLGLPFYSSNFLAGFVGLPFLGYVTRLGGIEQVGYIRISQSLAQLISFLPGVIAPVLVSSLSASLVADPAQHQQIKSLHFRAMWLLILGICLSICLSLEATVPFLFGKNYLESIPLVRMGIYGAALSSLGGILNQYLVAEGKTRVIGLVQVVALLLNILLALILIPLYSGLGLLLAQAIAATFTLIYLGRPSLGDIVKTNRSQLIMIGLISLTTSVVIFTLPTLEITVEWRLVTTIIISVLGLGLGFSLAFTQSEIQAIATQIKTRLLRLTQKA
ncbi:MAG: oligosaccharide flippase family protein [Pseudanabaenaceae cyanobacterium bins.68]|nr:oligosaccharide flippase family protein [Pseudanabaenaceae cyanobacterium bins.68]